MSLEPNARGRLHLVYTTTRDSDLRRILGQVLEEGRMAFVPTADLLRDVALCAACTQDAPRSGRAGLCHDHRARWNLDLVQGLLASSDGGAQLLAAFDRQRRALRMVWEAHARGAVTLPDSVAVTVEKAFTSGPRFLPANWRTAVHQAS